MTLRRLLILLSVMVLAVWAVRGLNTAAASHPATTQIEFVHYAQLGLPEQDVFVEPYNWLDDLPSNFIYPLRPHDLRDKIPSNFIEPRSILAPDVVRVEARAAQYPSYLAKSLYAAENVIAHDRSKSGPQALGPFAKGDAVGLTLRRWLAARGKGAVVVDGKVAEFSFSFQGLVPYGRYVLQCIEVPVTAGHNGVETDCPHWSGLQTGIQPDAEGSATLRLQALALPDSNHDRTTILQLVYERKVMTWNGDLGGYGWNEHVQLLWELRAVPD